MICVHGLKQDGPLISFGTALRLLWLERGLRTTTHALDWRLILKSTISTPHTKLLEHRLHSVEVD
jgi:hypothetical protein